MKKIEKTLTANDLGMTGSHQAGICVPKQKEILDFFPKLDVSVKNPRTTMTFVDEFEAKWSFNFIYYNNKLFGGTRNEFRLTAMTKYMNQMGLKPDDILEMSSIDGNYHLNVRKKAKGEKKIIELSNKWKIVS